MENKIGQAWASVVDFHTHLLPALDDGSASPEESALLLLRQTEQGIRSVIATPHFYAEEQSLESFLARRDESCETLRSVYDPSVHPTVYLGAEVAFFSGIGRSRLVEHLTIRGTNVLLVEMPFVRWTEQQIDELAFLREGMGMIPVVAHIERYAKYQKRGVVDRLIERGVLFQSNAEYFLNPKTAKKAIKQFQLGEISILGSDCHNTSTRVPNLAQAIALLEKNEGTFALEQMRLLESFLLEHAVPIEK